jgi:hypothetical protein
LSIRLSLNRVGINWVQRFGRVPWRARQAGKPVLRDSHALNTQRCLPEGANEKIRCAKKAGGGTRVCRECARVCRDRPRKCDPCPWSSLSLLTARKSGPLLQVHERDQHYRTSRPYVGCHHAPYSSLRACTCVRGARLLCAGNTCPLLQKRMREVKCAAHSQMGTRVRGRAALTFYFAHKAINVAVSPHNSEG